MKYVCIPVSSEKEGMEIAEEYFGSMRWNSTEEILQAYPIDVENPVYITTENPIDDE